MARVAPNPPDPAEGAAGTEARFRGANERLRESYRALGADDGLVPFLCECADPRCTRVFLAPVGEYDDVREHPARFILLPGHARPSFERVIGEQAGFHVVEKTVGAGEVGETR